MSIIVTNYNYERFLREALDSALGQTYADTEVIVVDDGSTDRSREIIAAYGGRITTVLKGNGGQASAFNAGFRVSSGDVVCFLDADDTLLPTAVESSVPLFRASHLVKVHWPLRAIDGDGRATGHLIPDEELAAGSLEQEMLCAGPANYCWPPTSGNAWARSFLDEVLPIPEREFRISADFYLNALAPAFGPIARLGQAQGSYRRHGANNYTGGSLEEVRRGDIERWEVCCDLLDRRYRRAGVVVDVEAWRARSWCHRLQRVDEELRALVAADEPIVLVDSDQLRYAIDPAFHTHALLERRGLYDGPPPNAEVAISELERMRRSGARWLVFAWPAFWWLDHYDGLRAYLRGRFPCVLDDDCLVAFDLGSSRSGST